jgi:GDP-mannose 6-dehydrogenase
MRAINHLAQQKGLDLPVMRGILQTNSDQLKRLEERIIQSGAKRVAMYGLTFKSGTDDVRESPMLYLASSLGVRGVALTVYDPDINLTTLRIEQPNVVKYIVTDPSKAFAGAELVVVCKKGFSSLLPHLPKAAKVFNFYNQEVFAVDNAQERLY